MLADLRVTPIISHNKLWEQILSGFLVGVSYRRLPRIGDVLAEKQKTLGVCLLSAARDQARGLPRAAF